MTAIILYNTQHFYLNANAFYKIWLHCLIDLLLKVERYQLKAGYSRVAIMESIKKLNEGREIFD